MCAKIPWRGHEITKTPKKSQQKFFLCLFQNAEKLAIFSHFHYYLYLVERGKWHKIAFSPVFWHFMAPGKFSSCLRRGSVPNVPCRGRLCIKKVEFNFYILMPFCNPNGIQRPKRWFWSQKPLIPFWLQKGMKSVKFCINKIISWKYASRAFKIQS